MSRSYVVGLPVILTVNDDGTVTAEVDLSEASDLQPENVCEGQPTDDATLDRDAAAIGAALDTGTITVS